VYAGGNLPTPLYRLYQQRFGFSEVTLTAVFAAYVLCALVALVFGGRLSDLVGRRPVLVTGLGFAMVGSVLFMVAGSLWVLFAARAAQGLSIGLLSGTCAAALAEHHPTANRRRAALMVTVATNIGVGVGPLVSAVIADLVAQADLFVFGLHVLLLVALAVLIARIAETVTDRRMPGWTRMLRPQPLAVPHGHGLLFGASLGAGFCGFAVMGLFSALTSSFLRDLLGVTSFVQTGLVVFVLFGASTTAQLLGRGLPDRPSMVAGLAALIAGLGVVSGALAARSLLLLVVGVLVAGAGQGLALRGSLALLNEVSEAHRRAAVNSSFFVAAYAGMALPVLGAGAVAARSGLAMATYLFAATLGVICVVAASITVVSMRASATAKSSV